MIQAYDLFKEDERGTHIFVETVIAVSYTHLDVYKRQR